MSIYKNEDIETFMSNPDFDPKATYTTDYSDVWEVEVYFERPSCVLVNLVTGEKKSCAINSLEFKRFKKLESIE